MQRLTIAGAFLALLLIPAPGVEAGLSSPGRAASQAQSRELMTEVAHAFNDIARRATPAVVSISTVKMAEPGDDSGTGEDDSASDETTKGLLPGLPGVLAPAPREVVGIGSGIVIRPNGIIATNNHVIENADKITVTLGEKRKLPAHVVGADPKTDLAVIQLDAPVKDLPTLSFGDSQSTKVGDWVIAIGSPFGLNQSVSFGIVSAKGRAQMGILDIEDFIQTDAAINPGSSGGPLLNSNGDVVGINTAIFSQGGGFMGIGFAVPSKIVHPVVDQLVQYGHVLRGWIGIMAQDLDSDLARHFKAPSLRGALVSDVMSTGPASRAKLQPGDVIVRYDGHDVISASDLKTDVGQTRGGSDVSIAAIRKGALTTLTVHVEQQPSETPKPKIQMAGMVGHRDPDLGLAVEDLPLELSRYLKLPPRSGVLVVRVAPGSSGFDAGLSAGDIVLTMNEERVRGAKDFSRRTHHLHSGEVAVLYVQRGKDERTFIPLKG